MAGPARFPAVDRCGLWVAGNLFLSAAVAWTAFHLQQEAIAPAVLFPLVVGAVLGAGTVAIGRAVQWPGLRMAVGAAAAWGLLVVVTEDYIGHRHHARLYDETLARQESPLAAMAAGDRALRPDFAGYLAGKVRAQPVWWCLDVILTAGAASLATGLLWRRPSRPAQAHPAADRAPEE